jgi:hypothetical protein
MNCNEYGRKGRWPNSSYYSSICLDGLRKTTKAPSQDGNGQLHAPPGPSTQWTGGWVGTRADLQFVADRSIPFLGHGRLSSWKFLSTHQSWSSFKAICRYITLTVGVTSLHNQRLNALNRLNLYNFKHIHDCDDEAVFFRKDWIKSRKR